MIPTYFVAPRPTRDGFDVWGPVPSSRRALKLWAKDDAIAFDQAVHRIQQSRKAGRVVVLRSDGSCELWKQVSASGTPDDHACR